MRIILNVSTKLQLKIICSFILSLQIQCYLSFAFLMKINSVPFRIFNLLRIDLKKVTEQKELLKYVVALQGVLQPRSPEEIGSHLMTTSYVLKLVKCIRTVEWASAGSPRDLHPATLAREAANFHQRLPTSRRCGGQGGANLDSSLAACSATSPPPHSEELARVTRSARIIDTTPPGTIYQFFLCAP